MHQYRILLLRLYANQLLKYIPRYFIKFSVTACITNYYTAAPTWRNEAQRGCDEQ